jgi:hypothetical protein
MFYLHGKKDRRYRCKACSLKKSNRWTAEHREMSLAQHRTRRKEQRMIVLCHYSGSDKPFCACCGEDIFEFLALDHKNNDGSEHRKQVGMNMVSFALANNYPAIFQVLCHNCNMCKGTYGHCVHEHVDMDKGPGRGRPRL